MCSVSVPCPLCSQTSFANIDSLRISLLKAANGPLACPLCSEIVRGLDKLTIHLFSHTNFLENNNNYQQINTKINQCDATNSTPKVDSNSASSNEINSSFHMSNLNLVPTLVDNKTIKCDVCELTFRTDNLLSMHYKLIHQNLNDGNQSSNDIKNELRYQCHLCPKGFKMKGSLRVHLKVVHLVGLPIINNVPKLSICDKIRKMEGNRMEYKEVYTTDPLPELTGNVSAASISNIQVTQPVPHMILSPMESLQSTNYNVNIPNNMSHISNKLITKDHQIQSTIQIGEGSNSSLLENNSKEMKGIEIGKPWECDVCAKSFTTKYFLKKHKRLHTGEMPYTCEICGKTFTFQQSYHKHLLYHSDEKPHSCQTCGRSFKELSTLHNHERIHSGEKPFKCEICEKCFRQRVSYLVHKRIHTGVMPYKCLICQRSFRYKVSQRTHKCTSVSPSIQSLPVNSTSNNVLNEILQTTEEMLSKSIDDFVIESCNKMGIVGSVENFTIVSSSNEDEIAKENSPSPSDKFQNLCLYSPTSQQFTDQLETINEDSFKKLLYGEED